MGPVLSAATKEEESRIGLRNLSLEKGMSNLLMEKTCADGQLRR